MNSIQLNFLEINNQNLNFKIYRKVSNTKEDENDLYFSKLPVLVSNQEFKPEYNNYLVSLVPREDFEEFQYYITYNNYLTNRILFDSFIETLDKKRIDFFISGKYLKKINICIGEVKEGKKLICLSSYFLNSKHKFGFLIDYRFKMDENATFSKEVQRYSLSLDKNYRSNRDFYKNKFQILKNFLPSLPDFFINNEKVEIKKSFTYLDSNSLNKKIYVFNNNNTHNSQFQGVKTYGPYKDLSEDKIKFYFMFKDIHKDLANSIYMALIGKSSPGTFPGLKSMFNIELNKDNLERIHLKESSSASAVEALDIIDKKLTESNDNNFILYIEDNDHEENQRRLYNFFKYKLLKRKVSFQVITNEKLSSQETLKWSVSSIALQLFSKLGGVPWLVKPSEEKCLILGIGQAYKKNDDNEITKQLAYSVCVDSSGLFKKVSVLASDKSKSSNFYESIRKSIVELLKDDEFKNYKKCAIHVPFTVNDKSVESIKSAASEISSEIEIKVIKVNTKNKFFGFSEHSTKVPYESSYIKLAHGEYLVWFEGLNYGKEIVYKRLSNPIHIKFLKFEGVSYKSEINYLQDVINLSGANWRGFNAKSMPISIFYSQIIADYTLEFEKIEDFDEDIISSQEPWFL